MDKPEIPLWHLLITDFSLRHNACRRNAGAGDYGKLLGVTLKENRFVFSGDPGLETAEQDQRAIRFVSRPRTRAGRPRSEGTGHGSHGCTHQTPCD